MTPTEAILEQLRARPEGLSRAELQDSPALRSVADWTLRRLLQALVRDGRVAVVGKTRDRRYRLAAPPTAVAPAPAASPRSLFSPESTAILERVSRPLFERTPCSWEPAFLDTYQPNRTRYLRPADLGALQESGRTNDAHAPAGTYARHILERLLVDLAWNSSRLEGNTYSLLDTERLFRERAVPEGRALVETQMLLNHKQAIEYLVEGAAELRPEARTARSLHGLLAENLLGNPADEGRLRLHEVRIGESVFLPLGVPQLVEEAFIRLLEKARVIDDPFEQAFFVLVQLPYLQPFADVNKRTARLLANLPLLQHNLQPLSFVDVPREGYTLATLAVYEERRIEPLRDVFLWAYRRSAERYRAIRRSLGEPDAFRLKYREQLREAVRTVVQERVPAPRVSPRLQLLAEILVEEKARAPFIEAARNELAALSEGTFARYGLRPSEFEVWISTRREG